LTSNYFGSIRIYFFDVEKEIFEWLGTKPNSQGFIKQILRQVKNGELVNKDTPDLELRKLTAQVKKLEAEVKIKEWHATHLETFDTEPSHAANQAMRDNLVSFIDEKNKIFHCPRCDQSFRWGNKLDLQDKKMLFLDHYYQSHGATLPDDKQRELEKL